MPGARQDPERQLAGKLAAALTLDLADRRILGRAGRDLGAGDEMAELGKFDEDVGGVGAGLVERARKLKRLGDLALHDALEQER